MAATRSPAHEWWDGTYDGANPCVPYSTTLHPCIETRIEHYVACSEDGCDWVDHGPQERWSRHTGHDGKTGGMEGADSTSDERSGASTGHLCVEWDLLDLVKCVGRGATEGGSDCSGKEDGDGGWEGREGDTGHDDQNVENGEVHLGELSIDGDESAYSEGRGRAICGEGNVWGRIWDQVGCVWWWYLHIQR